jgi:integrase
MSEKIVIRACPGVKKPTYQVEFYDLEGKRKRKNYKTKLDAENFRQELIDLRNRNNAIKNLRAQGVIVDQGKVERLRKPIQEALREFFESKLSLVRDPKDLRSLKIEKLTYNLFGEFIIEERERDFVDEITLLDLEQLRTKFQAKKLKNATIVRKETSIGAFLNYCLKHKYVESNVALGLSKLPITTPKRILYSDDQKAMLESALSEWAQEIFILLAETFARPIELERAVISDFDIAARELRVVSAKGIKIQERFLPLSERAFTVLKAVVAKRRLEGRGGPNDLIFRNSKGGAVSTDVFDKAVRKAAKDLKIAIEATPYALRHGGLIALRKMKVHMSLIGSIAGHRKTETTMHYLKNDSDELRNVIKLMDFEKKKNTQVG